MLPHILHNISELRPIEMDSIPPFERSPRNDKTRPIATTEILNKLDTGDLLLESPPSLFQDYSSASRGGSSSKEEKRARLPVKAR